MTDYPLALYRSGTEFDWDGKPTDFIAVDDEDALEVALKDGWKLPADYYGASEETLLDLSAAKIIEALPSQSDDQLIELLDAERAGKSRKGVLAAIEEEVAKR